MTTDEYNQGVKLWADDVFRFAMRSCGDRAVSQDAVQEAFASLWEHRGNVPREKGKPFLITVAYNRIADHFRHEQVRRDSQAYMPPSHSERRRPDEEFDIKEAVERALETLPHIQRSILQLKDVEGYSYKEISNILMISDQQVCVYLYRARVALKRQLKDYEYNA